MAMTPTSGGSSTGIAASAPRARRPGNSYPANRKARGTPTSAESATVASEIQTLDQSARSSDSVRRKSR